MNNKYLPIGTVCTLKSIKHPIMIIGIYSVTYNGKIVNYDYKGCLYPEGICLSNQFYDFNNEEIEHVDYKGYETENFDKFVDSIKDKLSSKQLGTVESTAMFPSFSNVIFDDNGYVVKADNTPSSNPFISSSKEQSEIAPQKLQFDENGVVVSDGTVQEETPGIQFDENGVVVSDGTVQEEETSEIKFNENGVVVSDGTVQEEETPGIQFDENGVVVSDGMVQEEETPGIQFDENGVVVSDGTALGNEHDEIETKVEVTEKNDADIQFDENGMVISINGEKAKGFASVIEDELVA